jgi:cupin superfamily acireductone dioxygenase involved in methionine salvage
MVLYNGNAEIIGNFRALNFYKSSDINIKEDIRLLVEGTLLVSVRTRSDRALSIIVSANELICT